MYRSRGRQNRNMQMSQKIKSKKGANKRTSVPQHSSFLIRWRKLPGMRHFKAKIQSFKKKAATEALALIRKNLRILARALMGHCGLNRHMFNLRLKGTDVCRLCQECAETPLHIICECPALMHTRSVHLGKHIVHQEEAHLIPARKMLLYLAATSIGEDI